jgi:hypothetical protein
VLLCSVSSRPPLSYSDFFETLYQSPLFPHFVTPVSTFDCVRLSCTFREHIELQQQQRYRGPRSASRFGTSNPHQQQQDTVENYQLGLPFVQRIINSSHNERTRIAPFQILFGNLVDLERRIVTPFEEILPKPISLTKTSSDLIALQQHNVSIAREILKKSDEEHTFKNSAQIAEYAPNTFVLVQQHTTPETRLHTLWRGPMKVIKSLKGQYTLLDLTTLKEKEYHSTQLKEFIFNPNSVSPLDVARKDYLEFFIEEILHHTGNTNRLSTLNFKVKWQGYDDT